MYVPLVKPNDIFYYFNEQESDFRNMVLDNFTDIENFEITSNNVFVLNDGNTFINQLLNSHNNVKIKNIGLNVDKETTKYSISLMNAIIKTSIEMKNFSGLINILTKILINSKIPSDPNPKDNENKLHEIILSNTDINAVILKFRRKILAPYVIDYMKQKPEKFGIKQIEKFDKFTKNSKSINKLKLLIQQNKLATLNKIVDINVIKANFNKRKNILIKTSKRTKQKTPNILEPISDVDYLVDVISNIPMLDVHYNKITRDVKMEMNKKKNKYYGNYINSLLKVDRNMKEAFEISKNIYLYEKKQNDVYSREKMNDVVFSFVNIAFEAWYINQNIAGVLKYYSNISDIEPQIIDSYVEKQDMLKTSLESNKNMVMKHLDNLYDTEGKLTNPELNFYRIFCEIKNNTHSTKLFQNKRQEKNNELIIKDIINPYVEGDKPRIQDFKMFYVLQNNNTQLKCLNQAELFLNTRSFINQIGKK
jgi:hypothetical protein